MLCQWFLKSRDFILSWLYSTNTNIVHYFCPLIMISSCEETTVTSSPLYVSEVVKMQSCSEYYLNVFCNLRGEWPCCPGWIPVYIITAYCLTPQGNAVQRLKLNLPCSVWTGISTETSALQGFCTGRGVCCEALGCWCTNCCLCFCHHQKDSDTKSNQQGVQARTEKEQALGLPRNLLNGPDKFCPWNYSLVRTIFDL